MAKKNLRILMITGAALLVTLAGLTALAAGTGHGPFGGHGACAGMAGHGPFGMHFRMMQLIDELDLNAEQKARLETIHQLLAERWDARQAHHGEHAQALISRLEQGSLTSEEVRPMIDQHIEQLRATAYAISDELVVLANSLDEKQRATLAAHVQEMHGDGEP